MRVRKCEHGHYAILKKAWGGKHTGRRFLGCPIQVSSSTKLNFSLFAANTSTAACVTMAFAPSRKKWISVSMWSGLMNHGLIVSRRASRRFGSSSNKPSVQSQGQHKLYKMPSTSMTLPEMQELPFRKKWTAQRGWHSASVLNITGRLQWLPSTRASTCTWSTVCWGSSCFCWLPSSSRPIDRSELVVLPVR